MAGTKKARVGRPLKFSDPKKLQTKITAYFADCDPHLEKDVKEWVEARDRSGNLKKDKNGLNYLVEITHDKMTEQKPYTISGLAYWLDCDRDTLLNLEQARYLRDDIDAEVKAELIGTVKRAKTRIETFVEALLHSTTPTGAIFNLKANYQWKDVSEEDAPPPNPIVFVNQVPTE